MATTKKATTTKTKKPETKAKMVEEIKEPEVIEEVAADPIEEVAAIEEPVEVEVETPIEPTPKESGWHSGYPAKEGWYLCKADEVEVNLYHYMSLSCKHHKWVTAEAKQAEAKVIVWAEPVG